MKRKSVEAADRVLKLHLTLEMSAPHHPQTSPHAAAVYIVLPLLLVRPYLLFACLATSASIICVLLSCLGRTCFCSC